MTIKMQRLIASACVFPFVAIGLTAVAGPATEAQNKLLAKRAAEADCYRKLAEAVYGIRINSETYVRDFVAENDEIRGAVNAVVKGVRLGKPRYYDDGICEIDGEVTVAKVVTELKKIQKTYYHGSSVHITDFEKITEYLKTDVIRATGTGAPRPDVPELPEGLEDALTPLPTNITASRYIPPIWKTVSAQGRLMAQRGARLDALRKLLEEIKGLRLTSDTLVRDFITESDEISARAKGLVVGASQVSSYFHDDELIVEVTMEVPIEKVITRIKEFHREYYRGRRVTSTDLQDIKKTIKHSTIRATGMSVPGERHIKNKQIAGVSSPDWLREQVKAVGQGTDPNIETAQGKLRAARAARLDALRQLAERIYGLQVDSSTTVRDFVAQYDEISTQVEAVLAGAVAGDPVFEAGVARVAVSVPAAQVWSVVNDQIRTSARRG